MHIKAASWISRLPEGRSKSLDAGCKAALQALWNRTNWADETDAPGETCWPSAQTVADDTGTTLKATRKRLDKLERLGWIKRDGSRNGMGWALAWGQPFPAPAPPAETLPLQLPDPAPPVAGPCPSTGTNQEQDREIDREQDQEPCAATPDSAEPLVLEPATPSPSKPRRKRQAEPAEPDPHAEVAAEVLALQREIRAAAYAHHRLKPSAFPSPKSKTGKRIARRLRAAIEAHGREVCLRVLEFQGMDWRLDAGNAVDYSTDSIWSSKSLAWSVEASARASPGSNRPRDGLGGMANDAKAAPGVWESVSH